MSKPTPIIFYGAPWCSDCRRSKAIFTEMNIPYHYIDLSVDTSAAETVTTINNGMQSIPTIVFPDGTILVEPEDDELREVILRNRTS